MSRLRLRFIDWFWHQVYWWAVSEYGTRSEFTTDLAERCIETRLAAWGAKP